MNENQPFNEQEKEYLKSLDLDSSSPTTYEQSIEAMREKEIQKKQEENTKKTKSSYEELEKYLNIALFELRRQDFDEKLEKAGVLSFHAYKFLHNVTLGVMDALLALHQRRQIPLNYVVPDIVISSGAETARARIEFSQDTNEIIDTKIEISKNLLKITGPNLRPELKSYSFAYLIGVEEVAHTVYAYQHRDFGLYVNPDKATELADYDSQDVEFHGLGWKIRVVLDAARRKGISPDIARQILIPLQERMQNAIKVRQQRKKSQLIEST